MLYRLPDDVARADAGDGTWDVGEHEERVREEVEDEPWPAHAMDMAALEEANLNLVLWLQDTFSGANEHFSCESEFNEERLPELLRESLGEDILRFNPAVEQMGKILSDTSKIRSLTAQRMSAASGRITDVDVAMDLMIHDVEVIQSLVKSPVTNIQACSVKTPDKPEGKDYITAILEFESGATANLTASRITQARVRTLTVTTDTNYIDMDFINQSINVHSQGRMPYVNQESIPDWMNYGLKGSVEQLFIPTNQPLSAELNHFMDCVRGNAMPRISGENALNALRVIWEIQRKLGFLEEKKDDSAPFLSIAAE